MTPSPLPAWPELEVKCRYKGVDWRATVTDDGAELRYERARAAYWEARCRLAVEALRNIESRSYFDADGIVRHMSTTGALSDHALDALTAIGELPKDVK